MNGRIYDVRMVFEGEHTYVWSLPFRAEMPHFCNLAMGTLLRILWKMFSWEVEFVRFILGSYYLNTFHDEAILSLF